MFTHYIEDFRHDYVHVKRLIYYIFVLHNAYIIKSPKSSKAVSSIQKISSLVVAGLHRESFVSITPNTQVVYDNNNDRGDQRIKQRFLRIMIPKM